MWLLTTPSLSEMLEVEAMLEGWKSKTLEPWRRDEEQGGFGMAWTSFSVNTAPGFEAFIGCSVLDLNKNKCRQLIAMKWEAYA